MFLATPRTPLINRKTMSRLIDLGQTIAANDLFALREVERISYFSTPKMSYPLVQNGKMKIKVIL